MKKKSKYTEEELEFLRTGYLSMHTRALSREFNKRFKTSKTEGQIKSTLQNHKITCGRKGKDRLITHRRLLSQDQEQYIKNNFKGRSASDMTAMLNAFFKTSYTVRQIKTFVHNHGINSGLTGCFKKGHKPWNTGTRGLTGANPGSFKKGHIPDNLKPIGFERICSKDGYILVKVGEENPYTGAPTRYKYKHAHMWEEANGPAPDGMVVAFRCGNKLDPKLKDLMLISRALLLRLNKYNYNDLPEELKPSVLALAKLEVKTFSILNKRKE